MRRQRATLGMGCLGGTRLPAKAHLPSIVASKGGSRAEARSPRLGRVAAVSPTKSTHRCDSKSSRKCCVFERSPETPCVYPQPNSGRTEARLVPNALALAAPPTASDATSVSLKRRRGSKECRRRRVEAVMIARRSSPKAARRWVAAARRVRSESERTTASFRASARRRLVTPSQVRRG